MQKLNLKKRILLVVATLMIVVGFAAPAQAAWIGSVIDTRAVTYAVGVPIFQKTTYRELRVPHSFTTSSTKRTYASPGGTTVVWTYYKYTVK